MKICEECGKEFVPSRGMVHKQRFCCEICQRTYEKKHKERRPLKTAYVCEHCGKTFYPWAKDRTRFCSRACAFAQQKAEGEATRIGAHCELVETTCSECGELILSNANRPRTLCSDECAKAKSRRLFRAYKVSIGRQGNRRETVVCQECGRGFEQLIWNRVKKYCSARCAKKAWAKANPEMAAFMRRQRNHVRRAREQHVGYETINVRAVFERDGWMCGICGHKVDRKLRFPDPMSASLDHIIPLARGGSHTWDNVQCAHLTCNCKKGVRDTEQLQREESQLSLI